MSAPWIGGEAESWRAALCSYSAAPGELGCTRNATWHGVHGTDPVSLPCCDEHLPIMRGLVRYVHPFAHPCGIPGSMFRPNECFTEWDEAELVTAEASAPAGAP